ncbi:MAG: hypothetical protein VX546_15250, partial [Myxococcota bacterium]|nr:hypothetical protein [Myxococcota bacterium]
TFVWVSNNTPVAEWWLYAGSSVGENDYYDSGNLFGETTATATGIPEDGSLVHVRLWYRATDTSGWDWVDFEYLSEELVVRFEDCGDGTVADLQTGLLWEKKTGTPGDAVQAVDHAVTVGPGRFFSPANITIAPGDSVTWTWAGGFHSVTSGGSCTADGGFDSGNTREVGNVFQSPEGAYDTPGVYPYHCAVGSHCSRSGMEGVVNVDGERFLNASSNPHDVNNVYSIDAVLLGGGLAGYNPLMFAGTAYRTFLAQLNGVFDPDTSGGCFANHCDWRVPKISELQTILVGPEAGPGQERSCSTPPCVDAAFAAMAGPTASGCYWSSTSANEGMTAGVTPDSDVWSANFGDANGAVGAGDIDYQCSGDSSSLQPVRAVRMGTCN